MRLKNAKSNVKIKKKVDYIAANSLSNDIIFFIVNFNLRISLIVLEIARRFRIINIIILIIKNDYIKKHTKKKFEFLKKINMQIIESNYFNIINIY